MLTVRMTLRSTIYFRYRVGSLLNGVDLEGGLLMYYIFYTVLFRDNMQRKVCKNSKILIWFYDWGLCSLKALEICMQKFCNWMNADWAIGHCQNRVSIFNKSLVPSAWIIVLYYSNCNWLLCYFWSRYLIFIFVPEWSSIFLSFLGCNFVI